jgi:hypothetical protein
MINTAVIIRQLGIPKDKYDSICRFVWDDENLVSARELDGNKAALLVCGSLVYRYAPPDIALMLMRALNAHVDIEKEAIVVSVVDESYLSFGGQCWELATGKSFGNDLPDIPAVESHAIDVKKAVSILEDVSSDPQFVREAGAPHPQGRRPMPPGVNRVQAGMQQPYQGRQPWGMGLRDRL